MTEVLTKHIPLQQKQVFLVHNNLLYRVKESITFIGRHHTNHLILTTPTISRFHARIKYEDGDFFLYDFGSTYGTYVNDVQIKMHRLKTGDRIKFAGEEILFVDDSEEIPAQTNRSTGELRRVAIRNSEVPTDKIRSRTM